ncbi:MAG: family 16 glycoside hydrolase, partial [Pirellulales bacterium]
MNVKILAVCAVALVWWQLGPTPARSATPEQALNSKVTLEFTSAAVENLVEYLELYSKAIVDLDAGVDPNQRLAVQLPEMLLKDALPRVLEPLGLKYEAQANRLLISRIDPSLPPPEYGFRVPTHAALDGWIALFDGQTTFGWTGGELSADSAGRMQLVGGRTNASFGDFSLHAWVRKNGLITLGGKRVQMLQGENRREVEGAGPIILGDLTGVLWLSIKPKGLQPLFNGRDLGDWKRIDRANLPEAKRPQWRVEDGGLRAIGGPGCVEYPTRYGDFVLQVDVRTRAQYANGGVFVRSIPGDFMNGYEAQV